MAENRRSPLASGYYLATRASTVAMEMALPAGLGYWLDTLWDTIPWLTAAGAILGLTVAMMHLIRMTAGKSSRSTRQAKPDDDDSRNERPGS